MPGVTGKQIYQYKRPTQANDPGAAKETESAIGVVAGGPDVTLNGTTCSKTELAPDTAFLGVYSLYDNDTMTYPKHAIGVDDSWSLWPVSGSANSHPIRKQHARQKSCHACCSITLKNIASLSK